jgi:cold shock CspA family protein
MKKGIIKFFKDNQGYGFITIDNNEGEIFFHISEWKSTKDPASGERVTFTPGTGKGDKIRAVDVKLE